MIWRRRLIESNGDKNGINRDNGDDNYDDNPCHAPTAQLTTNTQQKHTSVPRKGATRQPPT